MSDSKNLLTKLPPPSELPSFVMQKQESPTEAKKLLDIAEPAAVTTKEPSDQDKPQTATTPLEASPESDLPSIQAALSPITEGVKNSVFYSWMKDVSKVGVEKAKASIEKVVTTLDPQVFGFDSILFVRFF